jgi:hypothetical protein
VDWFLIAVAAAAARSVEHFDGSLALLGHGRFLLPTTLAAAARLGEAARSVGHFVGSLPLLGHGRFLLQTMAAAARTGEAAAARTDEEAHTPFAGGSPLQVDPGRFDCLGAAALAIHEGFMLRQGVRE